MRTHYAYALSYRPDPYNDCENTPEENFTGIADALKEAYGSEPVVGGFKEGYLQRSWRIAVPLDGSEPSVVWKRPSAAHSFACVAMLAAASSNMPPWMVGSLKEYQSFYQARHQPEVAPPSGYNLPDLIGLVSDAKKPFRVPRAAPKAPNREVAGMMRAMDMCPPNDWGDAGFGLLTQEAAETPTDGVSSILTFRINRITVTGSQHCSYTVEVSLAAPDGEKTIVHADTIDSARRGYNHAIAQPVHGCKLATLLGLKRVKVWYGEGSYMGTSSWGYCFRLAVDPRDEARERTKHHRLTALPQCPECKRKVGKPHTKQCSLGRGLPYDGYYPGKPWVDACVSGSHFMRWDDRAEVWRACKASDEGAIPDFHTMESRRGWNAETQTWDLPF